MPEKITANIMRLSPRDDWGGRADRRERLPLGSGERLGEGAGSNVVVMVTMLKEWPR
jgi:hypothetical protein